MHFGRQAKETCRSDRRCGLRLLDAVRTFPGSLSLFYLSLARAHAVLLFPQLYQRSSLSAVQYSSS